MNRSKIKAFVKEHKVEVIAGMSIVCGMIAYVVVGKSLHLPKGETLGIVKNKARNIRIPTNFAVGKVTELFEDNEEIVAVARNLSVNDLGKFGAELIRHGLAKDGAEAVIMTEFLKDV